MSMQNTTSSRRGWCLGRIARAGLAAGLVASLSACSLNPTKPAAGAAPSPASVQDKGPQIQNWQTSNGARVYFVAASALPMVDVRVVFDAGSARDGQHPGLAHLTNDMLDQGGAGKLDANAIAARFDSLGADFSTSSHRDMAIVKLRSLTDNHLLDPALAMAAQVIQRPDFAGKALVRERKRTLVALRNQQQSLEALTEKTFFHAVYGDHPYGSDPLGTPASVKATDRAALKRFYHRFYVGRNAVVAIVGDVSRADAHKIAERLVGGLPAGKTAPALPPAPTLSHAVRVTRHHPSTQTHILVGQPGMRRGDPDYFPLYVGNHILGGSGFSSLILQNIRVKHGLAYSAYSYFMPMHVDGPFQMGLQTRTDQADEAYRLLMQTVQKFIADGPTAEELKHAKENITGGFPLRLDSNRNVVEYLAMIGFYKLPLDYLDRFNARVEAVTVKQIKDAFARRVHPERMATVIVGQGVKDSP